jgi:hypothetical protein
MESPSNSNNFSIGTALRSQRQNPGDILALLLLAGGDIVQKAVAQFYGLSSPPLFKGGD